MSYEVLKKWLKLLNKWITMTITLDKFIKGEIDLFDVMDFWLWRDHFIFVGGPIYCSFLVLISL